MTIIPNRYQVDNDCSGITLNFSRKLKTYIDTQTSNRSEWIRESGTEFLDLLSTFFLPLLPSEPHERQIITISKPIVEELEIIYKLITEYGIVMSRSEFYRMSAIFKVIMDSIYEKEYVEVQERLRIERMRESKPNTVRIPLRKDKNGETQFKVYKILKKMEY